MDEPGEKVNKIIPRFALEKMLHKAST